ncbi:hypothetical protein ACFH04_00895 [Streptomyces noboritoensis]|uniref:Uncharacterized protein n=1 Tax=Streptomyces noboritoensis TaxID=67337 RepID=A0ABV6TAY3_9ACTN
MEAPVFGKAREDGSRISIWWPRPGGWQTLQLDYDVLTDPDEVLRALVGWTGDAACVASVYDSDIALVVGLGPDGRRWQACLGMDVAAGEWAVVPDDVDDTSLWALTPEFAEAVSRKRAELDEKVPGAAQDALAWARAAGFGHTAESASIEEVLRSGETFAEDLFDTLLDRLGFPQAVEPDGRD